MIKFKSKKSLLFLGGFILLTSIITSIGILLNSSLNEKVNAESSEGHITYILNGGEGNEEGTYEIGTKHTLERPTKEGYYFGGWYEDSEFQGNGYYCVPKEAVGNKTYYAKWVSNEKTTISSAFYAVIGNYDTEKRTTSYRNYSITKLMFSSFIPEGYVERTISPGYTSNFSDAKVYHNPEDLSEVAIVYEGPIAINISDANRLFQDWSSLEEIEIGNLDLSYVSSAKQMFYSCSSLARVYIHSFDNLSITNGTEMFRNASCSTLDLGNMNTSSMTDMSYMFSGCKAERLDLRSFNTANVSDFNNMFAGMRNAKFIDVSSFNLGSAIDVSNMFYNLPECTGSFGINGTSIRLGEGFDTSNVTSARYFVDSVGCNEIDFSTLDFSNFTFSIL